MITKRTSELESGDVVNIFGFPRTIASVETSPHVPDLLRVRYEFIDGAAGTGRWADPDQEWQVDAPSPLDLAVQRAQEMADYYEQYGDDIPYKATALSDLVKLLGMFRAAR